MGSNMFRDPVSGRIETASSPWLWTLLFGCFYFAYKKAWLHAGISACVAVFSGGLSWIVYPFFANGIIERNYVGQGWDELTGDRPHQIQSALSGNEGPSGRTPTGQLVKDFLFVFVGAAIIAGMMSGGGSRVAAPTSAAPDGSNLPGVDVRTLVILGVGLAPVLVGFIAFTYAIIQAGFRRQRVGIFSRIASSFFLGCAMFGIITLFRSPEELEAAYQKRQDDLASVIVCKQAEDAVRDRLKSPSSADFPGCAAYEIRSNQERTQVSVEGYVDADNSFGAKLRSPFVVRLSRAPDSSDWYKWKVVYVSVR